MEKYILPINANCAHFNAVYLSATITNGIEIVDADDVPEWATIESPTDFYEALDTLKYDDEIIYTHIDGNNEAIYDKICLEYGITNL